MKDLKVDVVKYDVNLNYIGLEYAKDYYPVHYLIDKDNKKDSKIYVDTDLSKDKMLEFIKINLVDNV